ncbi:hypothetical protein Tsubulata_004512 [Turnera subulata]|uniref:Rhodanese domain-containing protein n=1 Tax=Turnera subulata TaxID=218843 RepID=A0A9Q0GJG6_9ROSI|nr:hypothetical protein Tsubulata_004512 [Turnera subulata]
MTPPHNAKRAEPSPDGGSEDSHHREDDRRNKKVKRREGEGSAEPAVDAPMEEAQFSYKSKLIVGSEMEKEPEPQWEEEEELDVEEGDIEKVDGEKSLAMKSVKPSRIVRFMDKADMDHAILDGPWTIFAHALLVQPWTAGFRASSGTIDRATIWVRFLEVPVDWYHSHILQGLGNMGVNEVDGEEFKVVYEEIPTIYFNCGWSSQSQETCPEIPVAEDGSFESHVWPTSDVEPPASGEGTGKKEFKRAMKEKKANTKPLIVIVVETRISGRKVANVIRRLGYTNSHRVDARGYAGGIWVLWKEGDVGVNILSDHT